jgi:EpsI family protein
MGAGGTAGGRVNRAALVTAVALLAAGNLAVAWASRPEGARSRQPLADLPLRVADRWSGRDLGLDERSLEILKLSDYTMRVYRPLAVEKTAGGSGVGSGEGQAPAPVFLYVGYYDSQRTGATYHSPKNCLPGSGWQITESGDTDLSLAGGRLTVNRVVIEKELDRQLVLYWYQDRGRTIASEYTAKFFLVWDAMRHNRSDGAIVRISTPILEAPEAAQEHARRFVEDVWPLLRAHLPS